MNQALLEYHIASKDEIEMERKRKKKKKRKRKKEKKKDKNKKDKEENVEGILSPISSQTDISY